MKLFPLILVAFFVWGCQTHRGHHKHGHHSKHHGHHCKHHKQGDKKQCNHSKSESYDNEKKQDQESLQKTEKK